MSPGLTTVNIAPPQSICMVRLSAIGDVCNAQAAALALKAAWPETSISWVIGKVEAAVLEDTPGIEFIIFDKSLGARAYTQLRATLAGRRFDVLLMMHATLRANLASRMIRARRRIGFDRARARDFQWLFSNERIEERKSQHVLDGFLQFAEHLGVEPGPPRWNMVIPGAASDYAEEISAGASRVILISPCSSQRTNNFRNWSAANYARLADYAADTHHARVVLTGGPTALERDYGTEICARASTPPVNLIGKTSLKQLLALIRRASVVICPDSGPAHMATAVATAVVGLYATSNPQRTGPYCSQHLVVNAYPEAVRRAFSVEPEALAWGKRVRDPAAMQLIDLPAVCDKLNQALTEASTA